MDTVHVFLLIPYGNLLVYTSARWRTELYLTHACIPSTHKCARSCCINHVAVPLSFGLSGCLRRLQDNSGAGPSLLNPWARFFQCCTPKRALLFLLLRIVLLEMSLLRTITSDVFPIHFCSASPEWDTENKQDERFSDSLTFVTDKQNRVENPQSGLGVKCLKKNGWVSS